MSTSGSKSNEHVAHFLVDIHKARRNGLKKLSKLVETTKNHIRNIYGCDSCVLRVPKIYPELTSNEPNFFMVESSSKDFLVEMLRQKLCNPLSFKGFRMHHVNSSNFPLIIFNWFLT